MKSIEVKPKTQSLESQLENIIYFLKPIYLKQGHTNTIKTLQTALNALKKTSKNTILRTMSQLVITGQVDKKTQVLLLSILKEYPTAVLKHYVKEEAAQ